MKQGDQVMYGTFRGAFVRDYYGMAEVRLPGGVACVGYSELRPVPAWIVRQGTSSARISAPDYSAALVRAAQIGFKAPDSVVLLDESSAEAADRYLALVKWARERYTSAGLLTISTGGAPSAYSRIESAAWGRYMEGAA